MTVNVFSYGCYMDPELMVAACASARFAGTAVLHDWSLEFAGNEPAWRGAVANIVPEEGACVLGVLWEVSVSELEALDRREGVPDYRAGGRVRGRGHERVALAVDGVDGWRLAQVYAKWGAARGLPNAGYVGRVAAAYEAHRFDRMGLVRALNGAAVRAERTA